MKGFKKCDNGHFFKENLSACPYCPSKGSSSNSHNEDFDKTRVGGNQFDATEVTSMLSQTELTTSEETETFGSGPSNNNDKTQVFGGGSGSDAPTELLSENKSTASPTNQKRNLDRTFIGSIPVPTIIDNALNAERLASPAANNAPRAVRRIVGWLISYSLDPCGIDWRIYEGTNTIGRDPKNSIIISKDPSISSEHVVILYRRGKFKIKDKMTANGTFKNGEELDVEEAYDLLDGDNLKLGESTFKFKSAE